MTQTQWLDCLQVTIAKLVVVRHVATTQASRFDGNLEFTRTRVWDRPSFLFVKINIVSRVQCKHPTNGGQRGVGSGTARLPALGPVVHAVHLLLQLRILSSVSLGLGRYLPTLKVPLREKVGCRLNE